MTEAHETRPAFMPVHPGILEVTGIGTDGGIVELRNGSLAMMQGGGVYETDQVSPTRRISSDGGKSWGEPEPLECEIGVGGVIRLASGALGLYGQKEGGTYYCSSTDDGRTWTPGALIPTYSDFRPMHHSMVQLSTGRLLIVGYWEALNGAHPDVERVTATGWGWWRGVELFMEGHRGVEMGICLAYCSDDEGETWKQAEGGLFGWFNEQGVPDGTGGISDVYEPTAAETKDGRVLLFARCKRGRLVQSYSPNGGRTWCSVQPTELASSQSPPLLIRIPKTGDLLCVWNQASGEEIRRGFLRGRLSAAISQDSGLTWGHFKTLELMQGMDDAARIAPDYPIPGLIVGRPGLGNLPDGFAMFTYPNVDIIGDTVFIRYSRMWPRLRDAGAQATGGPAVPRMWPSYEERRAEMTGEGVARICPVEWFYR